MNYGYQPFGTARRLLHSGKQEQIEQGENMAGAYGQEMQRQQHESGLQSQEQRRRQYDSETARMGQEKKYGLLGNLLGASSYTSRR